MSETIEKKQEAFDPALLARMVGDLGDTETVAKTAAQIGALFAEFLPDVFQSETGRDIVVEYVGCQTGRRNALIANLGETVTLADAALRNWCPHFVLVVGNRLSIVLMEMMLGAVTESISEPAERALSKMELDLSVTLFEKMAGVLKSGACADNRYEPTLEKPHNASSRPKPLDEDDDPHSALIRMSMELGPVKAEIGVILPQRVMLKTTFALPKAAGQVSPAHQDWVERINEQVKRSQVTLEARIKLQALSLQTISKLAAGDVIPFLDKKDVHVEVNANGKDLYVCEFGRAGEKYMLRVKDNINSDDELLRHLMNS